MSRRALPPSPVARILLVLLLAGPVAAQRGGVVWETWSTFTAPVDPYSANSLGRNAAVLGDVDGDGTADFALGAPSGHGPSGARGGFVAVYSGADAGLLWLVEAQGPAWALGTAVAGPGDVDGDGVPDLAASARGFTIPGVVSGTVFLYSGRNGGLLRRLDYEYQADYWWYGVGLAGVGDLDGDGCGDLAVGVPDTSFSDGFVYLYSGRTGQVLHVLPLSEPGWPGFGRALAGPGDVSGDSVPDVAVGAPGANPYNLMDAGSVFLYDGRSGGLLWRANGTSAGDAFGFAVAPAGDVDGDGRGDLLVGAPEEHSAIGYTAGVAHVLSGRDGAWIRRLESTVPLSNDVGAAVSGGKDLDGDGVPDFVIGAPNSSSATGAYQAGIVLVFSGDGSRLLHVVDAGRMSANLGSAVALLGDVNGDGLGDFLAMAASPFDYLDNQGMILGLRPYLGPRESSLPVGGGRTAWELAFGPQATFWLYQVLASASGVGPVRWHGVDLPLSPDSLLAASAAGRLPAWALGFQGVLGAGGAGAAALAPGPGDLPPVLAGHDLYLAAVAGPLGQPPQLVSLPAVLHIEP